MSRRDCPASIAGGQDYEVVGASGRSRWEINGLGRQAQAQAQVQAQGAIRIRGGGGGAGRSSRAGLFFSTARAKQQTADSRQQKLGAGPLTMQETKGR